MAERAARAWKVGARSIAGNRLLWVWAAIWLTTRALMVVQVGFWDQVDGLELGDVKSFESWSGILATEHAMPGDQGWQYPPGATSVMLLPRLGTLLGVPFGKSFVALMLLFDLAGLALIVQLAKRTGRNTGVWVWLLAMPVLGSFPMLRFDLVPTVLAVAALVVVHRRPAWFGALAGVGASIKIWPIVVLFGEWDRRRLALSAAVAAGAIALVFVVALIAFGDQSTFFDNQGVRGLQQEAVAATPWHLRELVTGRPLPEVGRNGSVEVASATADAIAAALKWLGLAVLAAAGWWWLARERAIRRGRRDLAEAAVSRDFVFALVLAQVVVSRVLSPQFMIWLIGLAAVVLSAENTRLARPAWAVLVAVPLTAAFLEAPHNVVLRNAVLLFAALDAAVAMVGTLRHRRPRPGSAPTANRLGRHGGAGKPGGKGRGALDPL